MSKNFSGYKMSYKFNASHSMTGEKEKEHSHTFIIKIYISKEAENFSKFELYESKVKDYIQKYKKQYLNDMEEFNGQIPSLEFMCIVIYNDIVKIFDDLEEYNVIKVEIGDSPTKSVAISNEIIAGAADIFISNEDFNIVVDMEETESE